MARTMRVAPVAGTFIVVGIAVIATIGAPRIRAGVRAIGIGTGVGIVARVRSGVGIVARIGAGVGITVVAVRRVAVAGRFITIVFSAIGAGGHDDGVQDDGAVGELHGAVVVDDVAFVVHAGALAQVEIARGAELPTFLGRRGAFIVRVRARKVGSSAPRDRKSTRRN